MYVATRNCALIRPLIATMLGLVAVSACSTTHAPGTPAAESRVVQPPSRTTAAAPTSPSPPSAAALPAAADDANLDACRDGTCEVRVTVGSQIPFPSKSDLIAEVKAIGGGRIQLAGTWPGGEIQSIGNCTSCDTSITFATRNSPGSFDVHLAPGGGVQMNEYALDVVALDLDEAVVRVHPA